MEVNEKVQEYLNEKEKEYLKIKNKKRSEFLISQGLYSKIYSPSDNRTEEYPFSEYKDGVYVFYKKEPIAVSDEEYKAIKSAYKACSVDKKERIKPTIIAVINWVACLIFIFGFISGVILGDIYAEGYSDFNLVIAIAVWVSCFLSGLMMLGFSKIIELLDELNGKL
ncbi:MAG: hypothetical protein J6D42_04750 [Clostridia bacterium]|nr:hypothetical protein [Clostridia bacterium]